MTAWISSSRRPCYVAKLEFDPFPSTVNSSAQFCSPGWVNVFGQVTQGEALVMMCAHVPKVPRKPRQGRKSTSGWSVLPSLWDSPHCHAPTPTVETVGYFHSSLRDDGGPLLNPLDLRSAPLVHNP